MDCCSPFTARSVLTSAVGLVVIFPITTYLTDGVPCLSFLRAINRFYEPVMPLFLSVCFYILIEWVIICWRWYSSLLIRKKYFCFKEFWTQALSETIDMYDLQNWRSTLNFSLGMSLKRIVILLRLHKLLHVLRVLQMLVVLLSKCIWLSSDVVLGKILRQCHKHARYWRQKIQPTLPRYRYKSYAGIVECLCMPGEDPSDLWKASRSAINRIELLFKESRYNGSITTLFTPFALEWVDLGFQLVNKLQKAALPQVVKYFPSLGNHCWKMTVVSFIHFMIKLHRPVKSDRLSKVFNSCSQAWDLLTFLEESDSCFQADSLHTRNDEVSIVADKELSRLRQLYTSLPINSDDSTQEITIQMAKNLYQGAEALLKTNNLLGEIQGKPKDWLKIAPSYNLYKLCQVMETELAIADVEDLEALSEVDIAEDLISWTENSLRNVVVARLSMVTDILAKHCRICAQGFEEDKIWEAIYLAG